MKVSIRSQIRIVSAKSLIIPAVILVIMIAAGLVVPFGQIFRPKEVSSVSEVFELAESGETYVHFSLKNLRYTGYDYYKGTAESASYYFILEDDGLSCLFFLIPVENTSGRDSVLYYYTANAKIISNDRYFDSFLNDYSSEIGWSAEGLKKMCGGILVSDFDYVLWPYVVIFVLIIIIACLCIGLIIVCAIRIISPKRHPACRRLRKFGLDDSDFTDIEKEIKNRRLINAGNMIVTEHYLSAFGRTDLWIVPLFNIVWVFEYSKWRPMRAKNRLVYTLNVITSPREKFVIRENSKNDIKAITGFILENFTHITVGYTDEIRKKMNRLP